MFELTSLVWLSVTDVCGREGDVTADDDDLSAGVSGGGGGTVGGLCDVTVTDVISDIAPAAAAGD